MTNVEIIAELLCAPSVDIAARLTEGPDSAEVVGLWELNAALDNARRDERTKWAATTVNLQKHESSDTRSTPALTSPQWSACWATR